MPNLKLISIALDIVRPEKIRKVFHIQVDNQKGLPYR